MGIRTTAGNRARALLYMATAVARGGALLPPGLQQEKSAHGRHQTGASVASTPWDRQQRRLGRSARTPPTQSRGRHPLRKRCSCTIRGRPFAQLSGQQALHLHRHPGKKGRAPRCSSEAQHKPTNSAARAGVPALVTVAIDVGRRWAQRPSGRAEPELERWWRQWGPSSESTGLHAQRSAAIATVAGAVSHVRCMCHRKGGTLTKQAEVERAECRSVLGV